MGRKSIDKSTFQYWITKNLWIRQVYRMFFRKIELKGSDKIKQNEAVIIAPNHQNALMDALVFVTRLPFQTIFLARADIFKGKLVVALLTFMKMLPIYRIRDGVSSLGKNEEIFDYSTDILKHRYNPMCMFPEGNHGGKRRLRPLVKGVFRIAFQCQTEHKNTPYVKIVPAGVDYSHYQKFQQTLLVQFGSPIEVCEYWEEYEENQAKAINSLRNRLSEEMRKVMIDIKSENYYDTIMGIRALYRKETMNKLGIQTNKLSDQFIADKHLIHKLEELEETEEAKLKEIDSAFKRYSSLRDKLNFRDWIFQKDSYSLIGNFGLLLLGILLTPVFIAGLITNWPHYFISPKIASKIKDPQFQSTIKWGIAIVIQAIYYIILLVCGIIFMPFWWLAIPAIIAAPFLGIIAFRIRTLFIKTFARIRYSLNRKKSKEILEALQIKAEIYTILESII